MTDVTCNVCGSPHAYPPAPALCHTPFCQGRMGGSDEYVPSRIEATRNMSEPSVPARSLIPGEDEDRGFGWPDLSNLGVAPDVAERRQEDRIGEKHAPDMLIVDEHTAITRGVFEAIPVRKEDLQPGGFAYDGPVGALAGPQDPHEPRRQYTQITREGPWNRSPHQDVLLALPSDHGERKAIPVCTGALDYFPAALAEVAKLSKVGNDQHNPGEPLHWARGKSTDHADTIVRHLMQRGTWDIVYDDEGNEVSRVRHSTKVAWRALALLQEEIEREAGFTPGGE